VYVVKFCRDRGKHSNLHFFFPPQVSVARLQVHMKQVEQLGQFDGLCYSLVKDIIKNSSAQVFPFWKLVCTRYEAISNHKPCNVPPVPPFQFKANVKDGSSSKSAHHKKFRTKNTQK